MNTIAAYNSDDKLLVSLQASNTCALKNWNIYAGSYSCIYAIGFC